MIETCTPPSETNPENHRSEWTTADEIRFLRTQITTRISGKYDCLANLISRTNRISARLWLERYVSSLNYRHNWDNLDRIDIIDECIRLASDLSE